MAPSKAPPDRRSLRRLGHKLKPVVLVGKDALSERVVAAIDDALTSHELIKVKLLQSCTLDKDEAAATMAARTQAELIQRIGRTALLYRQRPEEDED